MAQSEETRCQALTDEGERCSRPAEEDGFCYQHDSADPTIDDADGTTEGSANATSTDGGGTGAGSGGTDDSDGSGESAGWAALDGIVAVRESLRDAIPGLLGRELDGVIEVTRTDERWQGTVEVVERPSVPDTQDILGQYEVELDADGTITGYRRIARYRRSDTDQGDTFG